VEVPLLPQLSRSPRLAPLPGQPRFLLAVVLLSALASLSGCAPTTAKCDPSFRLIWEKPIEISEPPHSTTVQVLLIGCASELQAISPAEMEALGVKIDQIVRENVFVPFSVIIRGKREERRKLLVGPLNSVLGRDAIDDVYFSTFAFSESL
jgi:hypothetical protein